MKQSIKNSAQKRSYEQVVGQRQSTPVSSTQAPTMASPKISKVFLPSPKPDDFSSPLNIQNSGIFAENDNSYGPRLMIEQKSPKNSLK